jgi:hypothetical protein
MIFKQPLPINACKQCIHVRVDSCGLNGQDITNQRIIPSWCPLPDPSARLIAAMRTTIELLRGDNSAPFVLGFLSLVATRLKLNMRADGRGIDIPLADGSQVHLPFDGFTVDTEKGWNIEFRDNGIEYMLRLGRPPSLHKKVKVPGVDHELWQECDLAT